MSAVTLNRRDSFRVEHIGPYRVLGTVPSGQLGDEGKALHELWNVPLGVAKIANIRPISVGHVITAESTDHAAQRLSPVPWVP